MLKESTLLLLSICEQSIFIQTKYFKGNISYMQIGKNDYNTFCKNKFVNMFNMKRKLCTFIDTTVTCMDCIYIPDVQANNFTHTKKCVCNIQSLERWISSLRVSLWSKFVWFYRLLPFNYLILPNFKKKK